LCEAELDSSLFELSGERFQVIGRRRLAHLVVADAAITVSGCSAARYAVGTRRGIGDLMTSQQQ